MRHDLRTLLGDLPGVAARFDEPLAPHTTYKVGGPADALLDISKRAGLEAALRVLAEHALPWLVLGNGSNVLVADAGFRGAVLKLSGELAAIRLDRDHHDHGRHRLEAGAGLPVARLIRFVRQEQLDGLSFLGGIPGTIGGAVRMNAGTRAGQVADALEAAELLDATHGARWLPPSALGLAYRSSRLPEGGLVTAARFRCSDGDAASRQRLDEVLAYRKRTQPLTLPSCGSVFANPPGDHAGRLIEAAGLKGHGVGGARVSEQHANWIVNTGGARARDIQAVIELCVTEVQRRFDVTLRHEVQVVGDWGDRGAWRDAPDRGSSAGGSEEGPTP